MACVSRPLYPDFFCCEFGVLHSETEGLNVIYFMRMFYACKRWTDVWKTKLLVTSFVTATLVINCMNFTAELHWSECFRGISIKDSAILSLKHRLRFICLAVQSSKIILHVPFSCMSTISLTKYEDERYFMEVAQSNTIKWIYFILIYLKCA